MQKTLLQITQAIAAECNLPTPTAAVSSDGQNIQKLLALIRSTCDDLLMEYDWQVLQTRHTLTTSDGVSEYDFPTDIERFIGGTFFDSTNRWGLLGPLTATEWEYLQTTQLSTTPFTRYRVFGDKIQLYPTPGSSSVSLVLEYISNGYVRDGSTGLTKSDFEQDSDVCLFDHRVVIYGAKLKFLASISQDTTAALVDFQRALDASKGSDTPAPRLSLVGRFGARLLSSANFPDGNWSV